MLPYIITAVVSIIITALIVWFAAALYQKKSANSKIGNAEEKARGIIDEAVKTAEEKKRESMLEIKEESIKAKNDLDKEIKERRNEISRNERRIVQKEENVDKKLEAIEKREAGFAVKEEELKKQKIEISKLNEQRLQELERISGLTSEQAKEYLLKTIEEDVKLDTAKMIKEMENKAKEEANRKAKDYVVTAIQKCAADHVSVLRRAIAKFGSPFIFLNMISNSISTVFPAFAESPSMWQNLNTPFLLERPTVGN